MYLISRLSTLLSAIMVVLFLPICAEAFVPATLPPSASSSQRFSSIGLDPAPVNLRDQVQHLLEKGKEQQVARKQTDSRVQGKNRLPNVYHARSKEECMEIVETGLNRLTVFKFYSSYCRACKRIEPRFDGMAKENPDVDFVYVRVSASNNQFIVQELGIPALPYGGIFHPEVGMAETMSVGPQRLADFKAIVESYRDAECQLPVLDGDELFAAPYERISSSK